MAVIMEEQMEDVSMSFETSMAQLEAIVSKLENDHMGLDEAIEYYEEGVALADECLKRLNAAELRVQELSIDSKSLLREG